MKKAVAYLEPFLEAEQSEATAKGKVLMATVKGDVHDIGKNIVGVVLQCNGYDVVDLGVMVPAEKILETARAEEVDVIGLSGLITPSLDQMVRVAREMKRLGFKVPLIIGGATTSPAHTAVRIEGEYDGATVHVHDASRAVGVLAKLLDPRESEAFVAGVRAEYEVLRQRRAGRKTSPLLTVDEARARRFRTDWAGYEPPAPAHPGLHEIRASVTQLSGYIDWTPFFQAWEVGGKYPGILDDPTVGEQARGLLKDAEDLLERMEAGRILSPKAVVGLFPANARGDDIVVWTDTSRSGTEAVLHGLRQQFTKKGRENLCLSDFIAPEDTGLTDWVGAFAVTAGRGLDGLVAERQRAHDDYGAILAKAVADRLAEALAEYAHERVRTELWGYAAGEALGKDALVAEAYRGIRPAPGYPACPDHTEKRTLFTLLDAEERLGMTLTESFAMDPPASVAGWYFAHPQVRYFGVGRIGRDQVEDYSARKGWTMAEAERWLAPNLGYEPERDG
jgi:5-methyltetrahydrofolate--homocysteine methyltransferase